MRPTSFHWWAFPFEAVSPQPFLFSSPKPFPTARSRYPALTRMLFNFHTYAAMDCSRPAHLRRFHRSQARILAKRLKALRSQAWDWETLLKQATPEFECAAENLRPL